MTSINTQQTSVAEVGFLDQGTTFLPNYSSVSIVSKASDKTKFLSFVDYIFIASIISVILATLGLYLSISGQIKMGSLVFVTLLISGVGMILTIYLKQKNEKTNSENCEANN